LQGSFLPRVKSQAIFYILKKGEQEYTLPTLFS